MCAEQQIGTSDQLTRRLRDAPRTAGSGSFVSTTPVRASRRPARGQGRNDPPGGPPRLRSAVVLADDEQVRVVPPAERASEGAPVQLERGQHLATLAHPHAVLVAHVGVPDSALGIDTDPVWVIARSLGPHPPVAEATVRADVVRREPVGVRLSDDQRSAVRGDRHPVGERDVSGDLTDLAIWRGEHQEAGRELAAGEVEADGIDVGVAPIIDHDVIPGLDRDSGQVGVRDQRPVALTAQQPPLRRVHDQQPAVGEEIDAHRERCDAQHHLVGTVGAEGDHLIRAPVREPQPSVVPAW